jgi:pimeloyl-ACP methyl ester carboxylesterase
MTFKFTEMLIHKNCLYFLILFMAFANACQLKNGHLQTIDETRILVSSEQVESLSVQQVRSLVQDERIREKVNYGILTHRITYRTEDAFGEEVTASGLLIVPITDEVLPLLSYQHGTIFPDRESRAPSYNSGSVEEMIAKISASNGYIVSVPDYVGYGESRDSFIAYSHVRSNARAAFDMMRASREFAHQVNAGLDERVFLAGWSKGAAVSLGMAREIEEELSEEFDLVATAPFAGPYNFTRFSHEILNANRQLQYLNTYVWVVKSFNKVYNINQPLSYYFGEYGERLQADIGANIPINPQVLFTSEFRENFLSGTDPLVEAIEENNTYDWVPATRITFYHGTQDDYVPIYHAEDAHEYMNKHGAENVSFVQFEGENHFSALPFYLVQMLSTWEDLK